MNHGQNGLCENKVNANIQAFLEKNHKQVSKKPNLLNQF